MPQTLVISTPDVVSSTTQTFPKQGVFNLKITRNGEFDTVELWFRSATANITLELAGASFQSTAQVAAPRLAPTEATSISGSTLAVTSNVAVTHYMKIKLNNGVNVAHLRCSYTAKNIGPTVSGGSTISGGNISGQAFVDYSKKPYISTSLDRMFVKNTVKTDLAKWDVSSVTSMYQTFLDNVTFNQPIGNWNVSNVIHMFRMFQGATSFNQDLSSWAAKFNVNVNLDGFFINNAWGTANYNKFLNALWTDINTTRPQAWASRTTAKVLGMGTSKYSAASEAARNSLIANGWTITDGGLA